MGRVTVIHYRVENVYMGGKDILEKPVKEITVHVDKKTNKETFDAWLSFIERKGAIGSPSLGIFVSKLDNEKELSVRFANSTHWMDVIIEKWPGFDKDVKIHYKVEQTKCPWGQDPHQEYPEEVTKTTWWFKNEAEWRDKILSLSPDYPWTEFADEEPFKYCEDRNGVRAEYVYAYEPNRE